MSGEFQSAPICLGADQKSFTEPGWFGRIVPLGIKILSTPTLCPPYGSEKVQLSASGVSGFWKPSKFQYVWELIMMGVFLVNAFADITKLHSYGDKV